MNQFITIMGTNAQKTGYFAYPTTPFGAFMSIVNRVKNSLISIAYALFGLILMVVLILLCLDHGVGSTDHL